MVDFDGRPLVWLGAKHEPLDFQKHYPCPVCRYGQIEGLFLVDAFSCRFCKHFFTLENGPDSFLRIESYVQPLKWQWSGDRWLVFRHPISRGWLWLSWILGILLIAFPTGLVWLAYHTFPPLPNQHGAMFPLLWIDLTFLAHFVLAAWIGLEYYQWPFYVALKFYSQWLIDQVLPET